MRAGWRKVGLALLVRVKSKGCSRRQQTARNEQRAARFVHSRRHQGNSRLHAGSADVLVNHVRYCDSCAGGPVFIAAQGPLGTRLGHGRVLLQVAQIAA